MYLKTIIIGLLALLLISCTENKQNEVKAIIDEFVLENVVDQREMIFDVQVSSENDQLVLHGETDSKILKSELTRLLEQFKTEDRIVLLPDSTVGNKTYGLVQLSVANLRSSPKHSAELSTQALLGTPVKILKRKDSWYQIQSPDNYISWVDNEAITRTSELELNNWKKSTRILFTGNNGVIYESPEFKSVLSDVTTGGILEEIKRTAKSIQVIFPDGRIGFTSPTNWIDFNEFKTTIQIDTLRLSSIAKSWTGRPYLWGGTSARAMDCSGFVKMLYFMNGMILARDASLQTRHGQTVEPNDNFDNFQTGDLLFFGRKEMPGQAEKITHVALSLGGTEFIHAAGRIRINSFNPKSTIYSEYRKNSLITTKRIPAMDESNGAVSIKRHPWY